MRIANQLKATKQWLPVLLLTAAAGAQAQTLTVTPADVVFSAPPGTTADQQQSVTLSVAGGLQGFYNSIQTVTQGQGGWLSISPPLGVIDGSRTLTLTASNLASIATGIHRIQVQFLNSQGANQATLNVTLDRTNTPRLTSAIGNTLSFAYNPSTGTTDPAFRFSALTSSVAGQEITFGNPVPSASWINVAISRNVTPADYTISINPGLLPAGVTAHTGTVTFTPISPAGSPLILTVNVTSTGTGTGTITVNPASVFYSYVIGQAAPTPQAVSVTSTSGIFNAQITTGSNFLTISTNQFGGGTTALFSQPSGTIIYPIVNVAGLAAGQYSGNILITNNVGTVNLPVVLNVSTTATGTLLATPQTAAQWTYPTSIADVLVSVNSSTGFAQSYTASITDCTTGVALFNVNQTTTTTATTPNTLLVSLNTAVAASLSQGVAYSCYLRLTPLAGGNATLVGLSLSVGSGGTGTGNFSIDPAVITKTVAAGGGDTGAFVVCTSTSGVQSFTLSPNVTWITGIFPSSFTVTPSSGQLVTFQINTSGLPGGGPHVGTISVTSGSGGTRTATVNVTVTGGTGGFTLTPTPNAVTFNASSGGSLQSQGVQINVSDNVTTSYSASATSTGNWLSVTTSGVLPSQISVTANPSGLATGTYTGTVTLTATRATGTQVIQIPVTLNVTTGITLTVSTNNLSFNHTGGATAPPSQNITLSTSSSTSIQYSAVATSTGSWLQVSPSTGNINSFTPATLAVSVNPTGLAAGTYTGTVQITASGVTQNVNVSLIVTQPTGPRITQIFNAASFQPTLIAAGEIVTISGTNLSSTSRTFRLNAQGAIDTQLEGVRVLFDGIPAPLLFVSPTQINLIVPYRIATNLTTRIVVETSGVRSDPVDRRVEYAQPGIFTLTQDGSGQGAILNQNFTVNAPSNPAARNSVVQIYATGEGQTSPPGDDGRIIGTDLRRPLRNVVVRIAGRPAQVEYAGSAPGQVSGLIQINARVPLDTPAGNVSVEFEIGEFRSQANVTLAVSSQVQ